MKRYSLFISAPLLFFMTAAQAGVIVGGTRVIYHGDKKETSISVKNPDKFSYLIQSWSDNGEKSTDKSPFMVTPPLFRLGAGQENTLRIIRTGSHLPEDKESLYWMNIKSIPATEKQDNVNTLQIAVKTRIKLIYRPQALSQQPESVTEKLTWKRSGSSLTVTNPTAYYMNFSTLKVGSSTVKDATYVAPMSTATFTIPANSATGDVRWTLISDYGSAGNEHRSPL